MIRKLLARWLSLALVAGTLASGGLSAAPARAEEGLSLTEEEQAYIERVGTLKVGYVQDRVPVSFMGENGELAGISRYIFDRIEQVSGLTFQYEALPTGDVTYDYLLNGGFALVTSVEYNEENRNANGILISAPYLSGRKVVVARNDIEFDYNADLSVAISTGSQTLRKVLGSAYPHFSLVDYDSISACFNAVNKGEADLMIQNQYVVEYWMSKPAYGGLKVIPVLGMDDQLCFSAVVAFGGGEGIPQEDGRLLIDILDKAIAALTQDEVDTYTIQAIMENQYRFTLDDFMYRYRYAVLMLSLSALVIVALGVLLTRQRVRSMEERAQAKARDQFLSAMSHEIRTPLNGMVGLNYLMGQRLHEPEKLAVYLRQSDSAARYLMGLVSDLLDMSKIQDRRMSLSSAPVDLELLFSTVEAIVRGGMSEKGIDFKTNIALPCPCVMGDEVRIQQVLLNLLDNARKFTPSGGSVVLWANQTVEKDGTVLTRAEVSDTGRGMSEEFQKHLFESFAREMESVSKGNEGTGLGLPISRRLAEMMGGGITFTSHKGEGSRFIFTFRGESAVMPAKAQGRPAAKPGILLAEDNELNGEIMLELLEGADFRAALAKNGREALEQFKRSVPGTYGVVLMDLLMPEMDGFEAAAAIRALDRPDAATVKIIACTANSSPEDRERARSSGMDGFLAKPIDVDELMRVVSAL